MYRDLPRGAIALGQTQSLLKGNALAPPHGIDLLNPLPIPEFPQLPARPERSTGSPHRGYETHSIVRAEWVEKKYQQLKTEFETQLRKDSIQLASLREACAANDPDAMRMLMLISHLRHPLPPPLSLSFETQLDPLARIALCSIEIPDFAALRVVKKRGVSNNAKWPGVSAAEKKRATENILCSLCIRAAYLVAKSDVGNWFDTIAVNANQSWYDAATGSPRKGVIASLQAAKAELVQLNLEQADPKACFRHLKGIATPSVEHVTAVRPIFVLNKDDKRIIKEKDVAENLSKQI